MYGTPNPPAVQSPMEEVIIPRDADSHVALTGDFRVARAAFEEAV